MKVYHKVLMRRCAAEKVGQQEHKAGQYSSYFNSYGDPLSAFIFDPKGADIQPCRRRAPIFQRIFSQGEFGG